MGMTPVKTYDPDREIPILVEDRRLYPFCTDR